MRQDKYFAVNLMEELARTGCATGQKDYVQAQQRAAQFASPFSKTKSVNTHVEALHTGKRMLHQQNFLQKNNS